MAASEFPTFEKAFALYEEALTASVYPHNDKNKKHQSTTSIKFCLDALDTRIAANKEDAASLYLRGRALKHQLTLKQPCADYDELVLEYLSDMVQAVQIDPQNDEYVANLAGEKLEYTMDLERHCLSLGEPLNGDSIVAQSVALSWGHTMEIARSALSLESLSSQNRLLALSALCHALLATEKYEECDVQVDSWINACTPNQQQPLARALVLKASIELKHHRSHENALKTLSKAIENDPNLLEALLMQTTIHRELQNYSAAIATWKRLLELNPDSSDFHYRSAADYELLGDKASAIAALKRSLELSPKHLFALNDLAFQLISSGQWAEALPLLQEVLTQGPNDDIPWINIANVLYHLKDYLQALRSINNAFSAKRVGNRPPSAEEWLIKIAILRALSLKSSEPSTPLPPLAEPSSSSTTQETIPDTIAEIPKIDFEVEIVKCFVQAMRAVDRMEQAQAYFEYADYLVEKAQLEQARTKMAFALRLRPGASIEHLNLTRLDLQPGTIGLYQELHK